jgi:hypothetical protein
MIAMKHTIAMTMRQSTMMRVSIASTGAVRHQSKLGDDGDGYAVE